MKNNPLSHKDYQIFMLKSLLWLSLAWGAFTLAIVGFFYASLIWISVGIFGIWLVKKAKEINMSLKISKELVIASTISLLVVICFTFFSDPSVFTGRDQGSFSEAAARLAQNHKLSFQTPASNEFFKLHEAGRALNFPGFYYNTSGQLVTQFSLVYISWLALFFAVFGVTGFAIANSLLLFTFFLSLYLLLRLFLKISSTIPVMILASTSFVFMWFSKLTLSENIAMPLLWLSILSLMMFLKSKRKLHYFMFLASSFLLCFARIEGAAFLVASIIVIICNKDTRQFFKNNLFGNIFAPIIFLLTIFASNFYVDFYFYKEIIKALLPTISSPQAQYLGQIKNNFLPHFYLTKIFYLYGLLGFFIVGTISAAFLFWKEKFYELVPFFITLPTFIYFFDSEISPDHPWMLRRFMFSLLPVAIFYTGLLVGKLLENESLKIKTLGSLVVMTLLIMNMPSFSNYLFYSENNSLLSQTQQLSTKFGNNDLVLIDQQASGDGWSLLSGPMSYLYGKNAVYFFNTQDLSKLDTSKFNNVYLIAPEQQVSFYVNSTIGKRLTEVDNYNLKTTRLDITRVSKLGDVILPEKEDVNISGKIFKISK